MGWLLKGTSPETNKSPLKDDGWEMLGDYFPFGARPIFRGDLLVLGRVINHLQLVDPNPNPIDVWGCVPGSKLPLFPII